MYNTVNTNNVLCFRRATNGYESEFLSYIIDSNGNVSSVVSSFYAFTSGILSQDKIRIMKEQGFNIYTESALYLVDN